MNNLVRNEHSKKNQQTLSHPLFEKDYNSKGVTQLITIGIGLVHYATQTDSDRGMFAALYQMSHLPFMYSRSDGLSGWTYAQF